MIKHCHWTAVLAVQLQACVPSEAFDHTAESQQASSALGIGHSLYSGTLGVMTNSVAFGNGQVRYEMDDRTRGGHRVVDYDTWLIVTSPNNVWGTSDLTSRDTVAVDVAYGAALTWDYFLNVHGRSGPGNNGVAPCSRIHGPSTPHPAAWGKQTGCAHFADSGAGSHLPWVSIDSVAHELTHALTDATAQLGLDGEPGGLAEATSDIFASMIEFFADNPERPPNYLIGEQIFQTSNPRWLRRMDDPRLDRTPAEYCWSSTIGSLPVYAVAGVGNRFFYVLAEGTGNKFINGITYNSEACDGVSTVVGIGRAAAARIWYTALTSGSMIATTGYRGARDATIRAARGLYGVGSIECQTVEHAWNAVAVPVGSDSCRTASLPPGGVRPHTFLNRLFNNYGDSAGCATWSGADGTQSIAMPDGQRAWFFSDTFLGAVRERPGFYRSFLRNSIVIQEGSTLRTITGGNTCQERNMSLDFFSRYARTPVVSDGSWLWSGDGKVLGSTLIKFYFRNVTSGAFWIETNTAIATIPVGDFAFSNVVNVVPRLMPAVASFGAHPIIWGAAIMDVDIWTYIYGWGVADAGNSKKLYLARVEKAQLANWNQWQFNLGDGDRWSARGAQTAARALPSAPPVEAGFSVTKLDQTYWLIQHAPNLNGGDIVAHPATTPWGFDNRRVRLYTPPEGPRDAQHRHQFYYEARLHPGLGSAGHLAVSYNVNTSAVSIGCRSRNDYDGDIYRPHFLDVPIAMFDPAAATAALTEPRAPVQAVPLADLGWYDQWSAPIKANGGCPPLNRATTLVADDNPDGTVDLAWSEYGRDMWYWIYQRDKTADEPFQKYELWSVDADTRVQPVFRRDRNGHEFEWYVVPFSTGGPKTDRNGDGRPDNWAPASNFASKQVTVQAPSAPAFAYYKSAGNGRTVVRWAKVTNPSDKNYYWVWVCSSPITCNKLGPFNYDVLSAVVDDAGALGFYLIAAENIGGLGPDIRATREVDPA